LAIGFGAAIVWPIAFVATYIPLVYAVVVMTPFGNASPDFGIFGMSVSILLPVISSTFLCTWILRMTLPRSPKVNA
jgi:hypothetical protein